jgi:Domain of unknown function (DUF4351)
VDRVQLGIPAVLTVVYLAKGDRAAFPAIHRVEGGGLVNEYRLERLFREEMQMLKEASFIEEWVREGIERGTQRAIQEGLQAGEARGARQLLLRQLRKRFGELPPEVVARVESADRSWCEEMGERLLDATSLDELGLAGGGGTDTAAAP